MTRASCDGSTCLISFCLDIFNFYIPCILVFKRFYLFLENAIGPRHFRTYCVCPWNTLTCMGERRSHSRNVASLLAVTTSFCTVCAYTLVSSESWPEAKINIPNDNFLKKKLYSNFIQNIISLWSLDSKYITANISMRMEILKWGESSRWNMVYCRTSPVRVLTTTADSPS